MKALNYRRKRELLGQELVAKYMNRIKEQREDNSKRELSTTIRENMQEGSGICENPLRKPVTLRI
jgi:hypothetical protein